MSMQTQAQVKASLTPKPSFTPVQTGLLQRKCTCGGNPGVDGECEECRKKRLSLQHRATDLAAPSTVALSMRDALRSPGQALDTATRASKQAVPGHDFSKVKVRKDSRATKLPDKTPVPNIGHSAISAVATTNSPRDEDDPIHRPIIETFRRTAGLPPGGVDEYGQQVGPSDAEIKYGRPTTQVEGTIDMTAQGLASGYLSGYGSIALMRVVPDVRTWDGIPLIESLQQSRSTCPEGLTRPGPCTGGDTFIVGQQQRERLHGVLPRMRNHFYDLHLTRSSTESFLHDPARNPRGMNACQVVCDQTYSWNGTVVGIHTITRNFRKGVQGGRNVTIIDVTKT